jgi:ATP-dependent DNA helicase RecG
MDVQEGQADIFGEKRLEIELLTSNEKGKKRQKILENVASGRTKILVGTHAIITGQVNFQNLGLVVIDEQHRFGVEQRLHLISKGASPHILSMTATPIPRTTILATYGNIAVSSIAEKPSDRKEIMTRAVPIDKLDGVVTGLFEIVAKGQKIYWVCPLIEGAPKAQPALENEQQNDYMCVVNRLESLQEHFGDDVQMLHGRMGAAEKDEVFQRFRDGKFHILVSTTVIEVGVDVADATVIIIENAERFGLAQLHQLRGRVGRSRLQSFCILLFDKRLMSKVAMERINIMRASNDGFYIAEKDLLLRGGGEIFGTRQSGFKKYRTFDIDDPASQEEIRELFLEAASLAEQIDREGRADEYSTLLEVFCSKNYKNIGQSF